MPSVHQDILQESNHIFLDHMLSDLFALHIASQVENYANHQVSEPIQVDFVGMATCLSLESLFQLIHDYFKHVSFLD